MICFPNGDLLLLILPECGVNACKSWNGFPMSCPIIQPIFSPQSVIFKKKVGRRGKNPMCVCVCVCECLWPTCLRLAVFGGLPVFAKIILEVTDGFYFLLPWKKGKKKKKKRKNRTDESHYRDEIRAGFRSLSNSQSLYNIRIMKGLLDTLKKKPRSRIGTLLHLYSQMHTRRWTSPPVRFIDLRRPAADRSAVPPTTD